MESGRPAGSWEKGEIPAEIARSTDMRHGATVEKALQSGGKGT